MYLARVNGQVHRVVCSTGYWRGWVVQGILEVVRKFAKLKLGEIVAVNEAYQFNLSWCEMEESTRGESTMSQDQRSIEDKSRLGREC